LLSSLPLCYFVLSFFFFFTSKARYCFPVRFFRPCCLLFCLDKASWCESIWTPCLLRGPVVLYENALCMRVERTLLVCFFFCFVFHFFCPRFVFSFRDFLMFVPHSPNRILRFFFFFMSSLACSVLLSYCGLTLKLYFVPAWPVLYCLDCVGIGINTARFCSSPVAAGPHTVIFNLVRFLDSFYVFDPE